MRNSLSAIRTAMKSKRLMAWPDKPKIGEAITAAENLVVLYGSDGLGLDGSSALASACAELVKSAPASRTMA